VLPSQKRIRVYSFMLLSHAPPPPDKGGAKRRLLTISPKCGLVVSLDIVPEVPFCSNEALDVFVVAGYWRKQFGTTGEVAPEVERCEATDCQDMLELSIVIIWNASVL
jgi:hypothetical protein